MENRQHHRHAISLPARIGLPAAKLWVAGSHRVANLSAGGLLVEAQNDDFVLSSNRTGLAVGGEVLIEVILPASRRRLRVRGRVVRLASAVFHDRLGLCVVSADPGYRALLRELALRRYERATQLTQAA